MFTGLIQSLGTVSLIGSERLQINAPGSSILPDLAIGDSVAVDGACLTVEEILSQGFVVTVSPETLKRTTLEHQVRTGAWVNLEPALRVGSKLGGHFVTGHVDGVGRVQQIQSTAGSWELTFTAPTAIAPYLIPKGSIAVNGISLTIAACDPQGNWFQVAIIPHSFAQTNLQYLQPGNAVNLEADLLGKYTAKLLGLNLPSHNHTDHTSAPDITPEFLAEHGFGG